MRRGGYNPSRMATPIEVLTPAQIVAELDRTIVGQQAAKRAVAVALRNRFRRQQVPREDRDDILPKNILMMGPTGVGKTEIARRLAQLARAPFVKVEATKFTEVGYVGRDVESMIRELVAAAVRLVEQEQRDAVTPQAEQESWERMVDMLRTALEPPYDHFASADTPQPEHPLAGQDREQIKQDLQAGKYDEVRVSLEVEEAGSSFLQVFTPQGMEEMGIDMPGMGGPFQARRGWRTMPVPEAYATLLDQEVKRLLERAGIHRLALERTEQTGIIFLDEIDKVAIKSGSGGGPDVSREGVQRDLLPIIEGSTVQTKFGPVRTDHILFIAAGAFHMSKPSDLIPELQGRLPIRVELEALGEDDFRRILTEPRNSLTAQYEKLLAVDGVTLTFAPEALDEVAFLAQEANQKFENIGARRLHTLLERLLEPELYNAPDTLQGTIEISVDLVRERLGKLIREAKDGQTVV
ncbi:MAG: ATP-dependent protease ATPase subunit HslU [Fimbriimonadaceae bacterium]|nr:ATP-dependent protease ATPase subunit HslU [Fimbriimonadaceae bacterium]